MLPQHICLLVQNRQQTHDWIMIGSGTNELGIQECLTFNLLYFDVLHCFMSCIFTFISERYRNKNYLQGTNLIFRKIFVTYSWKFLEGYFVTFFLTFLDRFSRIIWNIIYRQFINIQNSWVSQFFPKWENMKMLSEFRWWFTFWPDY